jgi:hypothetical protein
MPPRAKLLIIERLLPEIATEDPSAVIDLHMMVINGGRARKLDEFERLLAQSGLAFAKVHVTLRALHC